MWKLSIQYMVLGFEPKTWMWVSSHNHSTRTHAYSFAKDLPKGEIPIGSAMFLWTRIDPFAYDASVSPSLPVSTQLL